MLILIHDSVVMQPTDAIVNAANQSLSGGGGVDGAIHRAAGPQLESACSRIAFCPTGQAVVTPSFDIENAGGAHWIIHTTGPLWKRETPEEAARLLRSCYISACEAAHAQGARSISFCSISTGIYGYPLEDALPLALHTLLDKQHYFDEIRFCLFGDDEYHRALCLAQQHFRCSWMGPRLRIEKNLCEPKSSTLFDSADT